MRFGGADRGQEAPRASRRLAYVAAGPRVSTRSDAGTPGPRAHILGVQRAFAELGWEVQSFVAGDRAPSWFSSAGSDEWMSRRWHRRVAADIARFGIGRINKRKVLEEIGAVDWAYERFATFQAVGRGFQKRGIPWILEANGPFYLEASAERRAIALSKAARRQEINSYRASDVVVCVTHALRSILVAEGIDEHKAIVSPNGVDIDFFNPHRFPRKVRSGPPVIGFVGQLSVWQHLDALLMQVAELRSAGTEVRVVVVGRGEMRSAWEELAQRLGIGSLVTFTGHVPREAVPGLIQGFDLGYVGPEAGPSGLMYHSPLKLYEYMAMGKPVLAAAHEDASRAIEDGVTGFLFTPGDQASLLAALLRSMAKVEELGSMGRRARAACERDHTWRARVTEMIRAIDGVLSGITDPGPQKVPCATELHQ